MPVPKRKRSRVRRDKRFANKSLKVKAVTTCKTCAGPLVPHVVCGTCGHYKGKKIMATKFDRAEKRASVVQMKKSKNANSESVTSNSAV